MGMLYGNHRQTATVLHQKGGVMVSIMSHVKIQSVVTYVN